MKAIDAEWIVSSLDTATPADRLAAGKFYRARLRQAVREAQASAELAREHAARLAPHPAGGTVYARATWLARNGLSWTWPEALAEAEREARNGPALPADHAARLAELAATVTNAARLFPELEPDWRELTARLVAIAGSHP